MRFDIVLVLPLQGQFAPCIAKAVGHLLVQQFIAQASVEVFDEGVLLRLAQVDVMPINMVVAGLFQGRPVCELDPATPSE